MDSQTTCYIMVPICFIVTTALSTKWQIFMKISSCRFVQLLPFVHSNSRPKNHSNNAVTIYIAHCLHLKTFLMYSERYWWWDKALSILLALCRFKSETLVLTSSRPPTSPRLTLHKAPLLQTKFRYSFIDLEGMVSLVSKSTYKRKSIYITCSDGIEHQLPGPRHESMQVNQRRLS